MSSDSRINASTSEFKIFQESLSDSCKSDLTFSEELFFAKPSLPAGRYEEIRERRLLAFPIYNIFLPDEKKYTPGSCGISCLPVRQGLGCIFIGIRLF